jgi:hypothetical protein
MKKVENILAVIVHYWTDNADSRYGSLSDDALARAEALGSSISALHDLFNNNSFSLEYAAKYKEIPANVDLSYSVDVVVVTRKDGNILDHLKISPDLFSPHFAIVSPTLLGFEAHKVMAENDGKYDKYVYLEDDIIISDPLFFQKMDWFRKRAPELALLLPNRYEITGRDDSGKAYIDGDFISDQIVRHTGEASPSVQDNKLELEHLGKKIAFQRPSNPHAACFFLDQHQLHHWISRPWFLDGDTSLVGPLESAATLGILKTFTPYKPGLDYAAFLEVRHYGESLLSLIRGGQNEKPVRDLTEGVDLPLSYRVTALVAEITRLKSAIRQKQQQVEQVKYQLLACNAYRIVHRLARMLVSPRRALKKIRSLAGNTTQKKACKDVSENI